MDSSLLSLTVEMDTSGVHLCMKEKGYVCEYGGRSIDIPAGGYGRRSIHIPAGFYLLDCRSKSLELFSNNQGSFQFKGMM